jgi:hypothetical protein
VVRWLRTAWRSGYEAKAGILGGLGLFVFGVVLMIGNGYPVTGSYVFDVLNLAVIAAVGGVLVWALLAAIESAYGAGVLRGGRR